MQERGRLTVNKILDAAAELLVERGLPGLNTNTVAERAGVNISTLYDYFPDKRAIVHELAARFEDARATYVEDKIRELATAPDWRPVFNETVDRLVLFRLEEPAGPALRRTLMADPELEQLDRLSTGRAARAIASAVRSRRPHLTAERAVLIADIVTETTTHLLDNAFGVTPYDAAKISELKALIARYLAPVLDSSGSNHDAVGRNAAP